jgi:hypothetical protein
MPFKRGEGEQNRLNFWSSFNAKPKAQHKFIVRFGDNALFYSGGPKDKNGDGFLDIDLSAGGFGDLKAIPNLAWVVKSCTRPSWNISMKEPMYEQDGEFVGYKTPTLDTVTWQPLEIKLVNVTNHTFHPAEMPRDLDLLFSALIDASGYRFDNKTSTAGISDAGLRALPNNIKTNKNGYTIRSRILFDPFEIYDLSTDYVYKEGYSYNDPLGTPVRNDDLNNQAVYPTGKWKLYEPYLLDVRFGQNDYNNDNQFIEYTLKIGYYWAEYTSYAEIGPAVQEYRSKTESS